MSRLHQDDKIHQYSHVGKQTRADLCCLPLGKGCLGTKPCLLKTSDTGIIDQGYTEGFGGEGGL